MKRKVVQIKEETEVDVLLMKIKPRAAVAVIYQEVNLSIYVFSLPIELLVALQF